MKRLKHTVLLVRRFWQLRQERRALRDYLTSEEHNRALIAGGVASPTDVEFVAKKCSVYF